MEQGFELRSVFNAEVVSKFADEIKKNYVDFDDENFKHSIISKLDHLQFGERSELITQKLYQHLPTDFPQALEILMNSLGPEIEEDELTGMDGFIIMPQCRFVSRYGLDHFDLSMKALYEMTKRFTAEGDLRYFIQQYPAKTMSLLTEWTEDPNCHVRRLVSEGTRPRLPLAGRIPAFQKDPQPVLNLLEKLKLDPVRYVQRSVANNLNDISKDNPESVLDRLTEWKKIDQPGIQWTIKHALRSLIKTGNERALELLGYSTKINITLLDFKLEHKDIRFGEYLKFRAELLCQDSEEHDLMIDYAIHFMKANGKLSKKVFKLSQKTTTPGEKIRIEKKHSLKPISTRKYYPGKHRVELIINGRKIALAEFTLLM